jgi:hypothetical protein
MGGRPRREKSVERREPSEFDPMLDPLRAAEHDGGGAARRRDVDRILPYFIVGFVLAPLAQFVVLKLFGH